MAISIDWGTSVITVNKADMVLVQSVPSIIYELDLNAFRIEIKDLEDTDNGMMFTDTHLHNPPVSVGGAVLARVVEILSPYTVTFEDGQYRVNTVGANSNISERINVNQVSVSTSNSAGLQDLNSLQAASFSGEVSVNVNSSFTGTTFPIGTRANPVNNLSDAHDIGESRGIKQFRIISDMTLTALDLSDGHTFVGESATSVTLTIDASANVSKCTFRDLTIQGTLDNGNILRECAVLDVTNVNGFIHQCSLNGTVTLGGSADAIIMSCYSGVPGALTPTIDMGGSGQGMALRDYSGGIKIINRTGTDNMSIDMQSGQVIIDSTVSAGEIIIRGIAVVRDNSTGTATLDLDGVMSKSGISEETGAMSLAQFMAVK